METKLHTEIHEQLLKERVGVQAMLSRTSVYPNIVTNEKQKQDTVHRLNQIDRAIDMLLLGTYGHCDRCGITINPERLLCVPTTSLCIRCRRADERKLFGRKRYYA